MTNAELIAELRGHILSVPLTLLHDAADALEAAEKRIAEIQQIADHYEQTAKDYWKEACEYKQRIAELEKYCREYEEIACHYM